MKKSSFPKILFFSAAAACIAIIAIFSVFFQKNTFSSTAAMDNVSYHGNNGVSLMINVYWGDEFVQPMLETLAEKNVYATFFVGGSWVAKNDEMLTKISNAGHEIGNHGFNHRDHDKLSEKENRREIQACDEVVFQTIGKHMNLFAPPSGAFDKQTVQIATELGQKVIMWSKDTIDWRDHNEETIFSRATKNIVNGDMILMHPTNETASVLGKIIDEIIAKNLAVTTVSKNIDSF